MISKLSVLMLLAALAACSGQTSPPTAEEVFSTQLTAKGFVVTEVESQTESKRVKNRQTGRTETKKQRVLEAEAVVRGCTIDFRKLPGSKNFTIKELEIGSREIPWPGDPVVNPTATKVGGLIMKNPPPLKELTSCRK